MIKIGDYEYTPVYYIGNSIEALRHFMQRLDVPKEVIRYTGRTQDVKGVRDSILVIGYEGLEKIHQTPGLSDEITYAIKTRRLTAMLEEDYRELVGS